ncbi:FG-GAP-like repeat-containing protein [Micromonospora halophytica]|uniref:Repeat domain-containing protein n=1 Tax=Micromonospora halophytica TaxID=47864 RepID=A0A1C5IJP5_9ACTN|nr:FG-GAP-like repeat-containing protein [Micromonospora halophytica]SCG58006.1 Repeat domain-containing protein [Micromonospora halophytica]
MTTSRLLRPFVRTRTRLTLTLGVLLAAPVVALLPVLPGNDSPPTAATTPASESAPRDEASALAHAARNGIDVLVDTATTATSLTWALPDGQMRTTVHATPQRAKDATGRWARLDTTLTRDGKGSGALDVRPVNVPSPVRFSGGDTETGGGGGGTGTGSADVTSVLAELETDGHTITYTWPGPLPEPVLDGPRALYPEVRPGIDLLVVAREAGGFGQLLIVKNRSAETVRAADTLTYGLRSETAIFRHDPGTGGVRALDPADGREVGSIPSPFAWDSAGRDAEDPQAATRTSVSTPDDVLRLSGLAGSEPGARQAPIRTRVDGDGTGNVRLHLDAAGTGLLTDPTVTFPVFLDPTLISGTLAWATVYSQHPKTNTWNGTNFNSGTSDARVGYEQSTPLRTRSFWRMGFRTDLNGANISSASFKVLNNHSWSCTNREMQLWLTGAISSGTTWNSQPSWLTLQQKKSFAFGYGSGCADDYVSFDVRNAAEYGAAHSLANLTFGMRATSESDTLTWRKFRATSAELTVVYNRPPTTPTNVTSSPGGACVPGPGGGVTVARSNLVLSATATDPDNNLKSLRFRFWKDGTTMPAGTLVTPASTGKATLTIPSSTLEDKAVYSWNVRAEDSSGAVSAYFPTGTEPCRVTVDASAPPAPEVTSEVFREATTDGATWATVKFGETGKVTFSSAGATRFSYSIGGIGSVDVTATAGVAEVPALKPRHTGPNTLQVYAYDPVGNRSAPTYYTFYLPPSDRPDGPGDIGGDGIPDLVTIGLPGMLKTYPGDEGGELDASLIGSYSADGTLNPPGHWSNRYTTALVTKYGDTYPGDGTTDLFARTTDGGFWLYPGDGYGSFPVDRRLRVLLPTSTPALPAPGTWTQIKAVGDLDGDKLPDLVVRSGTQFWVLNGYTGGSFQSATLMEGTAWARREVVNIADIDLDGTPDLLWRNLDNGNMYVRHGRPGPVAGSVDLHSLKQAAHSRNGDVSYGTGWTEAAIDVVVAIPDVSGDGVPDLWVRFSSDRKLRVYHPSRTNAGAPVKIVIDHDMVFTKSYG